MPDLRAQAFSVAHVTGEKRPVVFLHAAEAEVGRLREALRQVAEIRDDLVLDGCASPECGRDQPLCAEHRIADRLSAALSDHEAHARRARGAAMTFAQTRLALCWTRLTGTPVAVTKWQPQVWRRGTWFPALSDMGERPPR